MTSRCRTVSAFVVGLPFLLIDCALADNLVSNPSAEKATPEGTPEGWGLYVGAGQMKFTASAEAKHSGERSACLELMQWHVAKGESDVAANRSVSGAVLLAPNNGYSVQGALECAPGTTYVFSFWYEGTVPAASVSVTGWPSAEADHTQRIHHSVSGGAMRPCPEWQRCTGSFRVQEGVRRFTLMIQTSGKQSEGFALGKLFVDDAEITPKTYPQGELRAIWCGLPKAKERDAGVREIRETVAKLRASGFNTLFTWASSGYLAALDRPELRPSEPQAGWDSLGELIQAAKQQKLQVHLWYSPWVYKEKGRAVELQDHPEWAAVSAKGVADKSGICLARPEVRQYELDLLGKTIDRYPDLAGIHIEEPGYDWGADYCYCDPCQRLCQEWFGLDIRKDPEAAKPSLHNLAAFMGTDFFARLRQLVMAKRPSMWLSANGSGGDNPDWYIGRDWTTWARRGYLDFYVPQLYTKNVDDFTRQALKTKARLGECDLVTGMAVSWSGIYPEQQAPDAIKAEIAAARNTGAKGFVTFHLDHFHESHFQAVREATDRPPRLAFVPEMETSPEVAIAIKPHLLSGEEEARHDGAVRRAAAEWKRLVPEIRKQLTPDRVRTLSRWAKPQMEGYKAVPALDKVSFSLLGADPKQERLILEGTIDTLPSHSPVVTRWLKVYLLYDLKAKAVEAVVVTIRGERLE